MSDTTTIETRFLKNLWDDKEAAALADRPLELLRYRSNLLGADLRITNFGGGNTSSKFDLPDPLTGEPQRVMAVKGSGGDLRSMGTSGFAVLYLDKLERLIARYRAKRSRTRWSGSIRFARSERTASPLPLTRRCTRFFRSIMSIICTRTGPSPWRRAPTDAGSSKSSTRDTAGEIIWVPWQRPGFELALMLKRSVDANPGSDGLILGGHGLFTWGDTQKECYLSSVRTIDQMGEFVQDHQDRSGAPLFGGQKITAPVADRESAVIDLFPIAARRRVVEPTRDRSLRRQRRRDRIRELAVGGRPLPDGHELSRSLPAHAHLSDVHPVGPRARRIWRTLKRRIAERITK